MANEYTPKIKQIIDIFKGDKLYNACLAEGELNECRLFKKYTRKVIDTEWLDMIEDCLPSLDNIVRNPRRFIVVEEDLIDTSRAKFVTIESVKYLAQHTSLITGIEDDMVIPSKLLNSSKEESYEVYENRFIYTLLRRLYAFIRPRYEALKITTMDAEQMEVSINRKYPVDDADIVFRLDTILKMPFDEKKSLTEEELKPLERLAKINSIVMGFLSSSFAREMNNSEPVRPPIQRTNVILKNPDFKKALTLWEYLVSYDKEGFDTKPVTEITELNQEMQTQYRLLVFLNSVILQNFTTTKLRVDRIAAIPTDAEISYENIEDYPTSTLNLGEVRNISVTSPLAKQLTDKERVDIANAIDRALTQIKINKVRRDKELRDKLNEAKRKKEQAYLEREVKLREKAREEAARQTKKEELEKLREEAQERKVELEKEKLIRQEKIEQEKFDTVGIALLVAQDRLDELAKEKAQKDAVAQDKAEKRTTLKKEKAEMAAMRNKLKREFSAFIDREFEEIDRRLKEILGEK